MVYKRYIKRGDKVYGPYLYHSSVEEGKVVSHYVGKGKKKNKMLKYFSIVTLVLVFVLLIFFAVNFSLENFGASGKVVEIEKGESVGLFEKLSSYLTVFVVGESFEK
ncbi:MAG: hypothetical protein ABIG28_01355 [archaeon]